MTTREFRSLVLLELDFGDNELIVRQHPDGMYTLDVSDPRLVLSAQDFQRVVDGVMEAWRRRPGTHASN